MLRSLVGSEMCIRDSPATVRRNRTRMSHNNMGHPQRPTNIHRRHGSPPLGGHLQQKPSGPHHLLRLREKVSGYCFKGTYVPGKTHNIADALSRAPIFPGTDELDIQIDTALAYLAATKDPALNIVHESIDQDYQQCITDIIEDTVCLLYTSPSPRDS